eukprot:Gb_25646 [translate_table: standard]
MALYFSEYDNSPKNLVVKSLTRFHCVPFRCFHSCNNLPSHITNQNPTLRSSAQDQQTVPLLHRTFTAYTPSPTNLSYNDGTTKYHVFLSFRGPDVRQSFVDHLYNALKIAGINTFIDSEKLEKGEDIGVSLEQAIDGSAIRIPIFSKNFADSPWCLNEVSQMCKSARGRLTIPLFYDVTPADVRYPALKGKFAQAFQKHISKGRYTLDKIDEWKSSLFQLASLSGWTLDNTCGFEARLVKLVVQDLQITLNFVPLEVAKFTVGLEEPTKEVINLLQNDPDDCSVRIVGICGMGGLGKTTLANSVYNNLYLKFDAATFVSDVRLKAQENKVHVMQQQILKDLVNFTEEVNSEAHGKSLMKGRLRSKKSLVILDDVDHRTQLEALAGDCFAPSSRVIVTTRDEDVFISGQAHAEIYSIKGLKTNHALELFSRHAFMCASPDKGYEELSTKVVKGCCGLPLSLEVLGASLYGKRDKKIWKEALQKLERASIDDIFKMLKISYDGLNRDEKEIFLDIACFFIGSEDIENAMSFWEASELSPNTSLTHLKLKSLVRIEDGRFAMHDQLRDMGRSIVAHQSRNPGKRSRLWKPHEVEYVLEAEQGTPRVRSLLVHGSDPWKGTRISARSLSSMRDLEFLSLECVNIEDHLDTRLPQNLRWLSWRSGYNVKCLLSRWNMENLAVLKFDNLQDMISLWNEKSHPKKLNSLKVLDIANVNVQSLPHFSNFTSLVRLKLFNCRELKTLPNSVGLLQQLESLEILFCDDLEELPESIEKLYSLQKLRVQYGFKLKTLPSGLGKLRALKELELSSGVRAFKERPAFFRSLNNVEKLILGSWTDLTSFSLEGLTCLHNLTLNHCSSLNTISFIEDAKCLTSLELIECQGLCSLPEEVGNLIFLQELRLDRCRRLCELPQSLSKLASLKYLNARACVSLSALPTLPQGLLEVDFTYCLELRSMPNMSHMKKLKVLRMSCCVHLFKLPGLGSLQSLQVLDITGCKNLTRKKLIGLEGLKSLESLEIERECDISDVDMFEGSEVDTHWRYLSHGHAMPSLNNVQCCYGDASAGVFYAMNEMPNCPHTEVKWNDMAYSTHAIFLSGRGGWK